MSSPVLSPVHRLVEPADRLQLRLVEHPQEDGLRRPGGHIALMERRAPQAPAARIHKGDGLLERCLAARLHHPTHVGGAGLREQFDRSLDIALPQFAVPVDSDHDVVPSRRDGQVQRMRRTAGGIVHDPQPRILGDQVLGDLMGTVATRSDRHDQFEVPRVVLIQHPRHRGTQMPLLVQDRHHDTHSGPTAHRLILPIVHPGRRLNSRSRSTRRADQLAEQTDARSSVC